jgi:hypothetical protein
MHYREVRVETGVVTHTYNISYSVGQDWQDQGPRLIGRVSPQQSQDTKLKPQQSSPKKVLEKVCHWEDDSGGWFLSQHPSSLGIFALSVSQLPWGEQFSFTKPFYMAVSSCHWLKSNGDSQPWTETPDTRSRSKSLLP